MPIPNDELNAGVFSAAPTVRTLTTSSARTAQLAAGTYVVSADVDCFFLQGGSTVTAAATSNPLWAKTYVNIQIKGSGVDDYIAGIVAAGTGNLYMLQPKG